MKTIDALKLVLIYKNFSDDDAKKYLDSFEQFEEHFLAYPVKSLRFDVKYDEFHQTTADGSIIDGEVTGLGTVSIAQYGVRGEEPERYAFYSEQYPSPLFIRLFDTQKTYSSFRNNSKITVLDTIPFMGAELLKYHSSNSANDRYAVFSAEDITISEDNIREFRDTLAKRAGVNETRVFSS